MRNDAAMNALLLEEVLHKIFHAFSIVYADFDGEEYQAYRERGIKGFVRFDERKIFFDYCLNRSRRWPFGQSHPRHLPPDEEDRTWAHEILSVYYYWLKGIIRHDDEVEMEARRLCENKGCLAILRRYQSAAREMAMPVPG
jgi:hypothetical protein